MTVNTIKTTENKIKLNQPVYNDKSVSWTDFFKIDIKKIPVVSDFKINLSLSEKVLLLDKLLEAYNLALTNVKAGNITRRGFAANVMTSDGFWTIATNFNNTRNDISSVCAERSAILASYNNALIRFSKSNSRDFDFKIKYICMAHSEELSKLKNGIIPCEDCLSWFNTTRYFDEDTLIISFERKNDALCLKLTKLKDLLPYKDYELSNIYEEKRVIKFSKKSLESAKKYGIDNKTIYALNDLNYKLYSENLSTKLSNQNISCSILTDKKIYSSTKIDWTKRWFSEPLELASANAIQEEKENCKILAVSYFGDNYSYSNLTEEKHNDTPISIKSLGRIRQKYASSDTLLILNLEKYIFVTTIGEYLPKKFIQGYKII